VASEVTVTDEAAWWRSLGAIVRESRREHGITQGAMAETLGLSRSSIANMEAGRQHPNAFTVARLVAILDLQIPGYMPAPEVVGRLLHELAAANHRLSKVRAVLVNTLADLSEDER
jgi:DNA-binding XRE family transcriptional regulator